MKINCSLPRTYQKVHDFDGSKRAHNPLRLQARFRSSQTLLATRVDQVKRFSQANAVYLSYMLLDLTLQSIVGSKGKTGQIVDAMRMGFDHSLESLMANPLNIGKAYENSIAFIELSLDLLQDCQTHIHGGRVDLQDFRIGYSKKRDRKSAKLSMREAQEVHLDQAFGFSRIRELAEQGRPFFEENPDLLPIFDQMLKVVRERLQDVPNVYFGQVKGRIHDPKLWGNADLNRSHMSYVHTQNQKLSRLLIALHWDLWRSLARKGNDPEHLYSRSLIEHVSAEINPAPPQTPVIRFEGNRLELSGNRNHLYFFLRDLGLLLPESKSPTNRTSQQVRLSDQGEDLLILASPLDPQKVEAFFTASICPASPSPNGFAMLRLIAALEGSVLFTQPDQMRIVLKKQIWPA